MVTPSKTNKLVELIGPGGRCKVEKTEVDTFISQPGWKLAPVMKPIPLASAKKKTRLELEDAGVYVNTAPENRKFGPVGRIVPTRRMVFKMTNNQLNLLIDELELKPKSMKHFRILLKRRKVNNCLEIFRDKIRTFKVFGR